MNAKTQLLATVIVLITAGSAIAGPHDQRKRGSERYDHATVIRVEPIYIESRVRVPVDTCEADHPSHFERTASHRPAAGSMVLGGLLGGLVGSELAQGRDRDILTVAGVLIGASIGHDRAGRRGGYEEVYHQGSRSRCKSDYRYRTERHIDGYWVTYRYRGQKFTTRHSHDPGPRIRVRVDVSPVGW